MLTNRIQYFDNKKEKIISGVITFIISALILFLIFTYKTIFTTITPPTYIDINFEELGANYGTDEEGLGENEPMEQETLLGAGSPLEENNSISKSSVDEDKSYLSNPASNESSPAISKRTNVKKNPSANTTSTPKNTTPKAGTGTGNAKRNSAGTAALDNLLKGKGSSPSSGQGRGGRSGQNQGTPAGGSGSGGEAIGNGRKLIGFIPGTMGRGGKVPGYDCTAQGTVEFLYVVDKNGKITSVRRKSGSSNTCLVNTGVNWIKQYVKADKGTISVSGTYVINFNK